MILSVVLITWNEERNLERCLRSVAELVRRLGGEIVVVDSGSTDGTRSIAEGFGARFFLEEWKGFAAQKNSALQKARGDWILSLDADEELSPELARELHNLLSFSQSRPRDLEERMLVNVDRLEAITGAFVARRNLFLGRWIRHGGFYPDCKLRLFRRGEARFEERPVHENALTSGACITLSGDLVHHAYPDLAGYIEHMNRYSTLAAKMLVSRKFFWANVLLRPLAGLLYGYVFRLGFLDGREGLLLHLYHAAYVSWKYAKGWELKRSSRPLGHGSRP